MPANFNIWCNYTLLLKIRLSLTKLINKGEYLLHFKKMLLSVFWYSQGKIMIIGNLYKGKEEKT